ncbi:MAG: TlpA family protein disulfide reductase [Candidatus Kariarchaeaceae archaeon]|jgi:thiol-disulfide isomerase/thioredoxin
MKLFVITLVISFLITTQPVIASFENIQVITTENQTLSFTNYDGSLVLLDGMATWCGPCRVEMEHLQVVYDTVGEDVQILSLSLSPESDTIEKLLEFKSEFSAGWTFALDNNEEFLNTFHPNNIPTMYLFNEEGNLLRTWDGITPAHEILTEIEKHSNLDLSQDIEQLEKNANKDFSGSLINDLFSNPTFKLFGFLILTILVYTKLILKPKQE